MEITCMLLLQKVGSMGFVNKFLIYIALALSYILSQSAYNNWFDHS